MADTAKYIQAQKFSLSVGAATTDTTITLTSFNFPDGTAIASGDVGTLTYGTLEPGTSREEQISFTGFTTNADGTVTLTGVTRGLGFGAADTYSEQSDLKKQHGAGATFIISNTAAFYDGFVNKGNDETITGTLSVPTPTSGSHAATKDYVDAAASGNQLAYDRIVVAATAGESVASGDLVYFDDTDNEWKKTDANTAATVNEVLLGIAQGSGSDGGAITGGVLIRGLDSTQTGMTVGVKLYASDTAGEIAETAGTTEKIIGFSKSGTELYFDPYFGAFVTASEKDALVGDGGTPSSTNPYTLKSRTKTAGATINGATLPVPVYQNKTDNEFYACDANDTGALKFLGFAISNSTDGNDIEVQFTGIVSGFTGLSEGEKYYVQDTVGTIGTSIGTYEVLVGVAISETELLIQKGKRRAAGSTNAGTVTATGSEAITCGFRPSVIRITVGGGAATREYSLSHITWVNGAITGISIAADGSATGNGAAPRFYDQSAITGNYLTFSITSVTDTGFTITYTETGTFNDNLLYTWEAEGEL